MRFFAALGIAVLVGCAPPPRAVTEHPFVSETADDASDPEPTPESEAPVAVEAPEPSEPNFVLPEPVKADPPAPVVDDDASAAAPVATTDQKHAPTDAPLALDTIPDVQCETPSLDPNTRETLIGAGVRSVLDWERAIAKVCQ